MDCLCATFQFLHFNKIISFFNFNKYCYVLYQKVFRIRLSAFLCHSAVLDVTF